MFVKFDKWKLDGTTDELLIFMDENYGKFNYNQTEQNGDMLKFFQKKGLKNPANRMKVLDNALRNKYVNKSTGFFTAGSDHISLKLAEGGDSRIAKIKKRNVTFFSILIAIISGGYLSYH